ncbi:MAG: sigma-70 family RNA polymerase sigma factor [Planctomycetes bacterium]|nr:sigma-70 family RNA polymerase sigma factor [Planctomycetota bacterium]
MEIEPIKSPPSFGSSGGPASPLDEVLAEEGFIRSLAKKLARDDELANDVFQETLLAAIRRPRKPNAPLRSWIARVVHNRVVQTHRHRVRREKHESLFEDDRSELSPAEVAERDGVRAHVVRAVEEMDEPYRSAIVLRFYEDLEPREMAARLGVPVETARTRVKRAMALLRARLDREYGNDTPRWASSLFLWTLPAPTGGVPLADGASAARWATGGVALVGCAILLWFALTRASAPPEAVAALERSAPAETGAAIEPQASSSAAAAPRETSAGPTLPTLAVRIVRRDDGEPLAGARVTLDALDGRSVERATDGDGAFALPWPLDRPFSLAIDATPATLAHAARLAPTERAELPGPWTIAVEGSTSVDGRAIDRFGEALVAARITAYALDDDDEPARDLAPLATATADAAGTFHFDHLPRRFALFAESDERAAADVWIADLPVARSIAALELVLDEPAPIAGEVQDRDGNALAGATLVLERSRGDADFRSSSHADSWFAARDSFEATTRFDGRFEFERAPKGRYQLTVKKRGFATTTRSVHAPVERLLLQLAESVPAEFVVVDERGEPIAGARARVLRSANAERGASRSKETVVTDAEGRIVLDGASSGTAAWLSLSAPGHAGRLAGPFEIARDAPTRRIVLDTGRSLTGRVRDDAGRGLAGRIVTARATPPSDDLERFGVGHQHEYFDLARTKTDSNGEFRFTELAREEVVLEVRSAERAAPELNELVGAHRTDIELVLRADDASGVVLAGKLRAARGAELAGATITALPNDTETRTSRVTTTIEPGTGTSRGEFRLALGAAGDWLVHVEAPGHAPWTRLLRGLDVGVHALDVELEPERSLRVRVVDPRGRPVTYATLVIVDEDDSPLAVRVRASERRSAIQLGPRGEARLDGLPARRVRLAVSTPVIREPQVFEVDLARETSVEETLVLEGHDVELARRWLALSLVNGERTELRLGPTDEFAEPWSGHVRITAFDAGGRVQLAFSGTLEGGRMRSDPNRQVLYLHTGEAGAIDHGWLQELRPNWGAPFGREFFPAPQALDALPIPAATTTLVIEPTGAEALRLEIPPDAADGATTLAATATIVSNAR